MRRAVTGYKGNIGSELAERGYIPIKSDITDMEAVYQEIQEINPDIIVHCAALTDVDYCEEHDREAFEVNVRGTLNVIDSFDGLFVYPSTVHVFGGNTSIRAYRESHDPSPVNAYGLTKLMGEDLIKGGGVRSADVLIVRASTIYQEDEILSVVRRVRNGEDVEVSDFIYRSFVYLPHFVDSLEETIQKKISRNLPEDVIHIAGNYVESYFGFYNQIARVFDLNNDYIIPRKQKIKDHKKAPRPWSGGLNVDMASGYGIKLYSSHQGLEEIKDEYLNDNNNIK